MFDRMRVVNLARRELGYKGHLTNDQLDDPTANAGSSWGHAYTKYGAYLDDLGWVFNGRKNGYAWCAQWVTCMFFWSYGDKNGQALLCQHDRCSAAGCGEAMSYFRAKGQYQPRGVRPEPGWQIFFWSNDGEIICHTGIVEKVEGSVVYTIEGNASNAVNRRSYSIWSGKIAGYGCPDWSMAPVGPVPEDAQTVIDPPEQQPATPATDDTAKYIWDYLMAKIGNPYGVAGLMGNLFCESGLRPNNVQNSYEASLHMGDAEYTAAVDSGKYTAFVKDAVGYGLAQWTYWTRKQGLLDAAKAANKSVGDINVQLDYMIKELETHYKDRVLSALKSAKSVKAASDIVLTEYEKPANQSEQVMLKRAAAGQEYYNKFSGSAPAAEKPAEQKPAEKPAEQPVPAQAADTATLTLPILREGDKRYIVKNVQRLLVGYKCLASTGVTGKYDAATSKAVRSFQVAKGLDKTGIVDAKTWEKLING